MRPRQFHALRLASVGIALSLFLFSGCGRAQTTREIYHAGLVAAHRGHNREALADFNVAVAQGPSKAAVYFNRAMSNYHLHRYISAESDFSTAIDLTRRGDQTVSTQFLHEAHYFRGLIRIGQSKWAPAIADLRIAAQVYPQDWHTWANLGYAHYRLHHYREAISEFHKSFALKPNDANDHFNAADAYFELGDYRNALADVTIAIRQKPSFGEAYQLRGRTLYKLHSYRLAEVDFTRAIHLLPKAWSWDYRCEARENLGDLKGALSDCNRAVSYYPRWSLAYIDRGWAKAGLGLNQSALADMRLAVAHDQTSPLAMTWLGWQLARVSRYHAAFAVYAHALELAPNNRDVLRSRSILAQWLFRAQHAGIEQYGIGSIDVYAALHEPIPAHRQTASNRAACRTTFAGAREYVYDCLYTDVEQATIDVLSDDAAMRQADLIHDQVDSYVQSKLTARARLRRKAS